MSDAELLGLLDEARTAHLTGDADLMVVRFADDFTSVDNGAITTPTREQSRARFAAYFAAVEFLAWDDLTPPRIIVADDGSLATVLVHKRVELTYDDEGILTKEETIFAWQETWRRIDGAWRLAVVTSTRSDR